MVASIVVYCILGFFYQAADGSDESRLIVSGEAGYFGERNFSIEMPKLCRRFDLFCKVLSWFEEGFEGRNWENYSVKPS